MKAVKFTCRSDFSRYCKGVPVGGSEAVACLRENSAKLTSDCRTSLADLGEAMPPSAAGRPTQAPGLPKAPVVMTGAIGRSCIRDLFKHCRNTGIGDGEKLACLHAHESDLTVLCKAAMKATTPLQ